MNLFRFFTPSTAARHLGRSGYLKHKQQVRDQVDRMRKDMGLKPVKWGRL